ncbi:ABC transporter permease [Chitinophagaceae bacterium LB-8]|uniref:ABC transporter permease n=1 Tax=Paraflavisolibacter caeni TaxID=2982496 RepID=A0A9X2XP98_9BACT|nr:ABC transporter permease [Paraflavisolibacter caeni]MCU7550334.1 ABC transporter permease [Paraflavisolibacter caeni]
MRRLLEVISSSFKMALQELWKNKLRTFLSLFGVTIGIFCIIGVLATVNSLEYNIRNEIKSLGTNTIYLDKWEYSGGPDYPWWKYVNRPVPKYREVEMIKERTPTAENAAFIINRMDNVEVDNSQLSSVILYGISVEFPQVQPVEIAYGRFMTDAEFDQGSNVVVIGNQIAEKLFGNPERAINKHITTRGKQNRIIGVIKKQGSQMLGGWRFDQSVLITYKYARTIMDELHSDPLIVIKGKDNINSKVLKDELAGSMRAIRKLSPTQEDNFSLNDINDFSDAMSQAFVSINIGGWAIAALSLIVGMFGVANIMFVTVKERTSQIGLKKAIGAKKSIILTEFLLESAFLCLIGGMVGLLLVFIMTKVVTHTFDFPIFISTANMGLAVGICIMVGILAGIIPASQAAKMDPVVAIRS